MPVRPTLSGQPVGLLMTGSDSAGRPGAMRDLWHTRGGRLIGHADDNPA
jgi:hypothetical protein